MKDENIPLIRIERNANRRRRLVRACLAGGLSCAFLDALNTMVMTIASGGDLTAALKAVASGMISIPLEDNPWGTILIGLCAHFVVSLLLAGLYCLGSLKFDVLTKKAVGLGIAYGGVSYLVLNFAALSRLGTASVGVTPDLLVNAIVGRAVLLGLPMARFARRAVWRERYDEDEDDVAL
jgi:hypothetical protein